MVLTIDLLLGKCFQDQAQTTGPGWSSWLLPGRGLTHPPNWCLLGLLSPTGTRNTALHDLLAGHPYQEVRDRSQNISGPPCLLGSAL